MAFSRKAFVNLLLPIIGLLLVAGALFLAFPSASAYSSCTPGATCDSAGQTCTYYLPTDSACSGTLTCNSYNQSKTTTVPYNTACFCMQNLQITQVTDQSLAGNGAEITFKISTRQSNQVNYRQETTYSDLFLFNSGEMTCSDNYCRNHDCRHYYNNYDYNSHDCGYFQYWDSYWGVCVSNSDYYDYTDSCNDRCGYNQYCSNGYCYDYSSNDYNYCSDNSDCGYNQYCSNGYCYDYNDYGYCGYDSDCNYGEYCDDGYCRDDNSYDYSCYDSDGGINADVSGYANGYATSVSDVCYRNGYQLSSGSEIGDSVKEAYCDGNGIRTTMVSCPYSCQYGECTNSYSYDSSYSYTPSITSFSGNGYSCSAGEYICGLPCSSYYSIDAACGSVMKSYCATHGESYLSVGPQCKQCGTTAQCSLTQAYNSNTGQQSWMINSFDDPSSIGGQWCKNDPPVVCNAYLSGPGLSRTLVGTYNFDTLPNVEYPGIVSVNQSYFRQQGTYALDVSCDVQLPSGSVACSSGCTSAGSTINFHVDTCNTAINVETDKVQYASGELMNIRGSLRNNNLPIGTTVYVRIKDLFGNTQATIPVTPSGGEFSTNWLVPSTLSTGSYSINASAQFNTCPAASSSLSVGVASCDVTVASTFTQQGSASPATVIGTVYNHGTSLSGANVTVKIYKDGSLYKQGYTGSIANGTFVLSIPGPFGEGTYSSQIDASYLTCPSVSSSASGSATFSGECDIHLMNGMARFSSTVSGVQVTGYIADSAGTRAKGTYVIEVRNKAGSVIGSTSGTTANDGTISATVANVAAGDYDVVVKSTSGSCTSTDKMALGGDFQVSLLSSPACGSASSVYQIKLKNGQSSSTTVSMTYSSASQVTLSGPSSVVVPASGEAVISVTVGFADAVSGGSLGVVNFNSSNAASSQSLELPICASGNLRVNIVDKLRAGSIGQRVCYNFQVENRGAESGTVTLSYDSGAYYVDGSFSLQQFRLSSYETRDDLQFCATVPNSQFYAIPIVLRATAPFSAASDTVAMSSGASNTDITIGFTGCPLISKGVQYPISLYNNGETANYAVEITDNGYLHPLVMPQVIYNFARYSNQVITVSVDPTGLLSANYVTLYIRKDGAIVKQQQLCFATTASRNASSNYASSLYAVNRSTLSQYPSASAPNVNISAPQIDYTYNGTHFVANASFLVKNSENRALLYEIDVNLPEGWEASYFPHAATIRSGDLHEFTVAISAANFQKRVYTGTVAIVDPVGRTASAPFSIDATNGGSSGILTGFFSAAGASSYAVVILVLLAIGAVLFYGIRKHNEAAA